MSLSPSDLRGRLRTHLAAHLAPARWAEGRTSGPRLGSGDSRPIGARSWSVSLPQTQIMGRDKRREAATATTTAALGWAVQRPADDLAEGYDDALAAESELLAAALQVPSDPELKLEIQTLTRREAGDWVMGDLVFHIHHRLSLTGG